jgi:hypothetical protein
VLDHRINIFWGGVVENRYFTETQFDGSGLAPVL